ncbi:hypothetical protein DESUT3_29570 [Desulfuromonas versatilis]|uniref:Outer membrane lipoprotein BamD-like domain-containing protein n=1 Tax=Desulfuromonas versatilis TaxID=2802975 RepID=A0ABM8HS79_9BACT|nr:outer membrane protein assembly factor BamD [Desulfuromonas versatilis]BCR05888.1 hypothetical protein DESUT3_29570 [Desulfuromonas versatilis]
MKRLLLTLLIPLLAAACTSTVVPQPKSAESYLQEGENFFERGLYDDAIGAWEKVRDSYYSPELNVIAELKIAEAYYLDERYAEAAAAYEDFLKQHPDHEKTSRVLYELGMSYYNQRLSADRDQGATRNALSTFESFLQQFPQDPKAEGVQVMADRCRDLLADHELYVGRFYYRTKKYAAASSRLEGLFKRYPNYFHRDEAYYYLGQAYLMKEDRTRAAQAFNELYREFPNSEFILPAQKLLEKRY